MKPAALRTDGAKVEGGAGELKVEGPIIGGDRVQGSGHGLEEQVVDDGLILQGQPGDGFRQGEEDVEVDDRQPLLLTGLDPAD